MNWYLKNFKNYINFKGRARREEYWMFVLFYVIAMILAMIIDNVTGLNFSFDYGYGISVDYPYGWCYVLVALIHLLPGLGLMVRRMHDLNKEGSWILINLIPIIGGIWFLVLACTEGTKGDNQFGPDPKSKT